MTKKKTDTSFNFGANLNRGKKPKPAPRRQSAATRQAYAVARRTGQYSGS